MYAICKYSDKDIRLLSNERFTMNLMFVALSKKAFSEVLEGVS